MRWRFCGGQLLRPGSAAALVAAIERAMTRRTTDVGSGTAVEVNAEPEPGALVSPKWAAPEFVIGVVDFVTEVAIGGEDRAGLAEGFSPQGVVGCVNLAVGVVVVPVLGCVAYEIRKRIARADRCWGSYHRDSIEKRIISEEHNLARTEVHSG